VYHVSRFLYERGGNIISSNQHFEELGEQFFMRVHFDRSEMGALREELEKDLSVALEKFQMGTRLTYSEERKKMAIMVSKYDHCLYDLLLRHQYQEIEADIAVVVSNHADLESVAASFKVPFYHVPVEKGTQAEAEEKALKLFGEYGVDFVVLARYMQILTPLMVEAYPSRIINVHHGFLPAFQGAKPYHQAYERGGEADWGDEPLRDGSAR